MRAIDAFVEAFNLAELGISPVRSSRQLEWEACRNLEVVWLLKNPRPGYRTIANFREENWKALKAANRRFVLLLRELGLIAVVVINGAFFDGNANRHHHAQAAC